MYFSRFCVYNGLFCLSPFGINHCLILWNLATRDLGFSLNVIKTFHQIYRIVCIFLDLDWILCPMITKCSIFGRIWNKGSKKIDNITMSFTG
ncbi:hypothetical protein REPUB_Repub03eG0193400 [Reevesia pubescens]